MHGDAHLAPLVDLDQHRHKHIDAGIEVVGDPSGRRSSSRRDPTHRCRLDPTLGNQTVRRGPDLPTSLNRIDRHHVEQSDRR